MHFRIVLCSEIRVSQAGSSPHTRALKLEHQGISNLTGDEVRETELTVYTGLGAVLATGSHSCDVNY